VKVDKRAAAWRAMASGVVAGGLQLPA
jgi:hypothetical protein